MTTGSPATYVLSWTGIEIDGQLAAPSGALRRGSVLVLRGVPVRVDGPADILPLGLALGDEELHRRAARTVRRRLHLDGGPTETEETAGAGPGVTVTDGRRSWRFALIGTGAGRPPLLACAGLPPPRGLELWVVACEPLRAARRIEAGTLCFTPGAAILTAEGPRPVESLREGQRLQTKDNGLQELLWIGRRRISGARLQVQPELAPVRLEPGTLAAGRPERALLLSPDHRVVVTGAGLLYGADEVLVAARDLVDGRSARVVRGLAEVTYIHLMLPGHEILFADGVECDSFHPAAADPAEIAAGLAADLPDPESYGPFARRRLSCPEAAILTHAAA